MKKGKQTCRILKDIRRQIAEANDIEFITSECQYQGDCLGTCPKCESEVRYLEQQLERKRMAGKAITVLGISAGLVAMSPMTSCSSSPNKGAKQEVVSDTLGNTIEDTLENTDLIMGDISCAPEDSIQGAEEEVPAMLGYIEIDTTAKANSMVPVEVINGKVIAVEDEQTTANDILDVAAVMPEFPGGATALMNFLAKNIKYPENAQGKIRVQGRVIVQFVIDKEGNILHPQVVRGVDTALDNEALRVVNLMPKWKPGELKDGTKVAVRFTIPVVFRLP